MTAGHSKRIALYADEIAQVINLDDKEREVLRTAALLHDYGKIAIREAILTKDGQLTEQEYKHIKRHPLYTKSILEKINFARHLKQVPLIAASHHEKLDGSGYPSGLKGDEIPKLGKILAVADVFDALTSKRHYRDRMDIHKVMKLLTDGTGVHFDKFFVEAFKKVTLDRLVLILEEENKQFIDTEDLKKLSQFSLENLLDNQTQTHNNLSIVELFETYYSRSYLKEI